MYVSEIRGAPNASDFTHKWAFPRIQEPLRTPVICLSLVTFDHRLNFLLRIIFHFYSISLSTTQHNATVASRPSTTTGRMKTSVQVTALDGIVNVNSLFTMAIFIGFSLTVPSAGGAGNKPSCNASVEIVREVIVYEVISFSFFLFSSLIAQSLKLAINLVNSLDPKDPHKADMDSFCMKYGLFGSAVGSVLGCTFLMLSIVEFIQVKLGVFGCGGKSVYAIVTMVLLVGSSLLGASTWATRSLIAARAASPSTSRRRGHLDLWAPSPRLGKG
ncbi:hypothetical protein Salat_2386400 [Sesamum alatum]|uniref:Maternal effect embryo arrest 60 n=1 Tax=Sesamum alatum TaxID=300844 RepID=A0AAE2CF15_9LAMI|nr:hypothetical protein Salat_2386400 [Sesamum alatum]